MPTLTGWIDYDRPHIRSLAPAKRIDYFETRTRLVALNPMRRLLHHEVHPIDSHGAPIMGSSALLILGVAACCSIESIGKFVRGDTGNNGKKQDRFEAFLNGYMNGDYQAKTLNGMTYGAILWKHFRNGLAHGFAVCRGGYEGSSGDPYFAIKSAALQINPTRLLDDLECGFAKYLTELRSAIPNGPLFQTFDNTFMDVFVNGN